MNKLYAKCTQCNRVIYASQAAENDGVCGPDCPVGPARPAKAVATAPAPAPRERIVPPPEPAPIPAAPSEAGGNAPVGPEEGEAETLPALHAEDAPEARQSGPGSNRMHRAAERGGSR